MQVTNGNVVFSRTRKMGEFEPKKVEVMLSFTLGDGEDAESAVAQVGLQEQCRRRQPAIRLDVGDAPVRDFRAGRRRTGKLAMTEKPHKGRIENWSRMTWGDAYVIAGVALDHPQFAGHTIRTSFVVSEDKATGEIETRNSRYTLVGGEITGG